MLIYKAQNIYPARVREVVSEIEGASPKMKVVLPHEGKVRFDEPIPIRSLVIPTLIVPRTNSSTILQPWSERN
ncbi:hypothetical protein [Halostagnicola kamekurae]|uniref:hypothetical protein n=1 Tax=Halostagnicola kamekurae TaxID=619731 RepID=UPI000B809BAE|nr:hypothetical protein [Halostagnicola kamekurae]